MLSNRLILMLAVFLFQSTFKNGRQQKIYFIDNDDLVILNGNVKQMTDAPVDDIYSTNPGQDYDIVDIDKQGDVTKIVTGFHGSIFKTYYTTMHNTDGRKLETRGYIKQSDFTNVPPNPLVKPKQIDTEKKLLLVYKYNKQNEIVNYIVDPNKPNADSSTYKYNDKGELIELDNFTYSKRLMDVTKYKYDNNSDLIELDKFHWDKLMVKTTYEYKSFDLKNNWIDMTVHSELFLGVNQIDTFKIHRKITYY